MDYTETGSRPDQAVCRLLFEIIMLTVNWFSFLLAQIIRRQLAPSLLHTPPYFKFILRVITVMTYMEILLEKQVSCRRIKMSTPLSTLLMTALKPFLMFSHQFSLLLLMHSILGRLTTNMNLLLPTLSPLSLLWMLNASSHHTAQNV